MKEMFLEHGAAKPQLLELSWQNLENVILEGSQNPIESIISIIYGLTKKSPRTFVRGAFLLT